jgi:ornithine--oxo-acid transaminase
MLGTGEFQQRSAELGARLDAGLRSLEGKGVETVRSRGLWAGIDIEPSVISGRDFCERLMEEGVLAKEAHGQTVRLAPPLVASEDDIDLLVRAFTNIVGQG